MTGFETTDLSILGNKILLAIFLLSFLGAWVGVKFHESNIAIWISIWSLTFISVYFFRVIHDTVWGVMFAGLIPLYFIKTRINNRFHEFNEENDGHV